MYIRVQLYKWITECPNKSLIKRGIKKNFEELVFDLTGKFYIIRCMRFIRTGKATLREFFL